MPNWTRPFCFPRISCPFSFFAFLWSPLFSTNRAKETFIFAGAPIFPAKSASDPTLSETSGAFEGPGSQALGRVGSLQPQRECRARFRRSRLEPVPGEENKNGVLVSETAEHGKTIGGCSAPNPRPWARVRTEAVFAALAGCVIYICYRGWKQCDCSKGRSKLSEAHSSGKRVMGCAQTFQVAFCLFDKANLRFTRVPRGRMDSLTRFRSMLRGMPWLHRPQEHASRRHMKSAYKICLIVAHL